MQKIEQIGSWVNTKPAVKWIIHQEEEKEDDMSCGLTSARVSSAYVLLFLGIEVQCIQLYSRFQADRSSSLTDLVHIVVVHRSSDVMPLFSCQVEEQFELLVCELELTASDQASRTNICSQLETLLRPTFNGQLFPQRLVINLQRFSLLCQQLG